MIPKRSGDRIKTDRRDAVNLARLHRAGELTAVFVPGPEDEAIRDVSRSRKLTRIVSCKRARQQLGALLLRQNIRYTGKTPWSKAHQRWLASLTMPLPAQQIVFQEYLHAVDEGHQRTERITDQLSASHGDVAYGASRRSVSDASGRFVDRGSVDPFGARGSLAIHDDPRSLMAFVGLVPSQYSSGPRQRLGAITKTGNSHARRMLVEAAWAYRFPARVTRGIRDRQENANQKVCEIAWKAQVRLCSKYRRLLAKGKIKQVITTAIARELLGFMWAILQKEGEAAGSVASKESCRPRFACGTRAVVWGILGHVKSRIPAIRRLDPKSEAAPVAQKGQAVTNPQISA